MGDALLFYALGVNRQNAQLYAEHGRVAGAARSVLASTW